MTDHPYITKTWLVAILVAILLSGGGWVVRLFEAEDSAHLARIHTLEARVIDHTQALSEVRARQMAQNEEILRRLDRIESNQDRVLERLSPTRRPSRVEHP